ncbi:MAG: hypothetical protein OXI37_05815 [Gammaproteobacteria bacterium]|nr:hypothetical protein [Gammaproteobacteria bacterium]
MSVPTTRTGNALPMTVHNVGFLLDRLGQDCSPLQFLRELTQNGIEAITRTNQLGQIVWDVDWISYDLVGGPMKLCITDTGDGMTGEEMQQFINQLSSSGSKQSISANYGVGAKIAAATKNPAGVIYQSWKDGQGWMIHLEKSNTGEYGLRQWELADGNFSHYFLLDDSVKPDLIKQSGTKVVLLGPSDYTSTMIAPEGTASPSRWISKYLNTRYYCFPEGTTVKVREGWDFPRNDTDRNVLRTITGQKQYLDDHCTSSGEQKLEFANVKWWILKDEPALTNNSGFIESAGHMAALYQDELYDQATSRAGTAMLQQFGILFGMRFVVLYVEPVTNDTSMLTTNTARTTLLINGEKLPWSDWAYEFRENMPAELAQFVQEKALASTEKDHVKSIKDRLKGVMDLYRVRRYKPVRQGVYLSDPASVTQVTTSTDSGNKGKGGGDSGSSVSSTAKGSRDSEVGNVYHLFEKKNGGVPSERSQSDPFPIVKWVTIKDGTRDENDMEDKAAKYLVSQNTLFINADFRVFSDMIDRLTKEKNIGQRINITKVVTDVVHQWFEQALIETVIGIQQLKGSKEWSRGEVDIALSEESLSASVMQRYHVFNSCKRELGAKLGRSFSNKVD